MKKNEAAVFKQAFDELEKEGYFNDISSKIKRTSNPKDNSEKRTRSSTRTKKTKARYKTLRSKVKVH